MLSPRNEKNTAYTLFPEELLETIKDFFQDDFADQNTKGTFFTFGQIYPGEIVLRVGYLEKGSIAQKNFDTSIDSNGANVISALEDLVFTTKELFLDYFKNQNLENFSYHWNPLNSSSKVYYKFDATNTDLESQADTLLGDSAETDSPNSLIVGEMSDSEEIERIIETLQTTNFTFK